MLENEMRIQLPPITKKMMHYCSKNYINVNKTQKEVNWAYKADKEKNVIGVKTIEQ